jgi:ribosomal protein S18 acetylase RimI-like enzyme
MIGKSPPTIIARVFQNVAAMTTVTPIAVRAISVRPLSQQEVSEAVSIHIAAFQGFYLTALGPRFLRQYYLRVMKYTGGICIGTFVGGTLAGFVAGFVDSAGFYQQLRSASIPLGLAALPALIADPGRIMRFVVNYRRTSGFIESAGHHGITAELTSLAVLPGYERRGIGASLVRAFVAGAPARGAHRVTLTTDACGNDAVNRFYVKQGFRLAGCFEAQPGRFLNQYWINAGSE